ncbi:hypothetical protein CP061683_0595, partial [Chlamydia psittaci 06-1683]
AIPARLGRNCQCTIAVDKQSIVFLQKNSRMIPNR